MVPGPRSSLLAEGTKLRGLQVLTVTFTGQCCVTSVYNTLSTETEAISLKRKGCFSLNEGVFVRQRKEESYKAEGLV